MTEAVSPGTLSKIEVDTDRNYFMSASEAKEYGLIDKVYQFDTKGTKK